MAGSQKIGEMNGIYARMMKICLWAFFPTMSLIISVLGVFTWWFWRHEEMLVKLQTQVKVESERNQEFRNSKDQFTKLDATDLVLAINENRNNIKSMSEDIVEIRSIVKEIRMEIRK